jgi:hypothetical protein
MFLPKVVCKEETVLSMYAAFMAKYKFFGRGKFVVTDQSKVLIAATYVMLTLGCDTT